MPDPSDSTAPNPKAPVESAPEAAPEAAGKPGQAGPPAEPLSLVPRSRSGSPVPKEGTAPAAPAGAPASFTDLMQWMKMFAAASAEAPPAEATKPGNRLQRTTLPKEQRKFQRFDREPGTTEATMPVQPVAGAAPESRAADDRSTAPAEEERATPPASRPVPVALTGGTSGRRLRSAAARRPRLWLALELGAVALLAAVFWLGRLSVRKVPSAGTAAGASSLAANAAPGAMLNPDAAKMIDEAMAAEQDRNFDRATALLLKVQKDFPQVRDLDFRLANLAMEQGDPTKALLLLNQAIDKGEQSAAAYKLRGTILNRKGNTTRNGGSRGMNDFETATMIDPFSAESFYFWGEALRRAGKPQAALVKLQQAIDRLREPELEAEYRLKIRTTMIELGREKEFAPEMAAMLAENPPPPDWLLTAAAIGLQHHDFADAASYLEKASHLMDPDLFNMRMRDYFFFGYRFEKPLAKFFAFATTARPAETPAPISAAVPPDTGKAAASNPTPAPLPSGTP